MSQKGRAATLFACVFVFVFVEASTEGDVGCGAVNGVGMARA